MSASEARRRRQLDQLRDLCRSGSLGRALDLAFEHVACFGQDDEVVFLLEATVDSSEHVPAQVRRQLAELRAVSH